MTLLQSFNLYILSLFTKSFRTGLDVNFILKRYQTLSVIYSNLFTAFTIIIWASLDLYGFNNNSIGTVLSCFPLIGVSFYFLKKGNLEAATICVLAYYHLDIFVMSKIFGATLKSLGLVIAGPCCILLLSSSTKMYIVNTVLCVVQNIHLILDLNEKFRYTMSPEQSHQIFAMQVLSFMVLGFVSIVCFIQKQAETNLWKIAQSNYERAENINKEVVQAVESKDNFVSSLSHEIRNPLNVMKGSIDYLLSVVGDAEHMKILEQANTSSEVLLNLVNNILDAAKLKADKMELMYIETKPLELIQKSIMMYSSKLKEKENGFQAFIDRNSPPTLWVDHARLMQILMNLFSNCVKFAPVRYGETNIYVSWCDSAMTKGQLLKPIKDYFGNGNPGQEFISCQRGNSSLPSAPSIFEFTTKQTTSHHENLKQSVKHFRPKLLNDVMCTAEIEKDKSYFVWNANSNVSSCSLNGPGPHQAEGFLKVQVSDNGSGISPEHTANLFSMFSQGSHNVHGSSGLGLWICKQLCEKMGGDITLYTELNKGTSFVFYIPVNNENLTTTTTTTTTATNVQENNQRFNNERVKALVVDDFAYNRDIHRLLLEREGVQVSLANDGKEALEKYKEGRGKCDFIMMDIQMPEMDGFTAAKKIREWEEEKGWKKVDIYFVSGEYYDENEIRRELKNKGGMSETAGVRCLRKPIDVQIVRTLVEKFL